MKAYIGDEGASQIEELITQWNHTALDIEFMTELDRTERKDHMVKFYSTEAGSTLAKTEDAVNALEGIILPKLRPDRQK